MDGWQIGMPSEPRCLSSSRADEKIWPFAGTQRSVKGNISSAARIPRQEGAAVLNSCNDIVLGTAAEIAVLHAVAAPVGRRRRRRRREWTSPTTFARWPTRERASAEPALYCATSAATGMIKYRVYANR